MNGMLISQRVGILLDEVNLFLHGEELFGKVRLDTAALLGYLNNGGGIAREIVRVISYCVKFPGKNVDVYKRKVEKLGVEVKCKPVKIYSNGDRKGDWDVQICIDAIQLAQKVDTIVLGSNDADFVALVKHLRCLGVRVELLAFEEVVPPELVSNVDCFLPLKQELFRRRK